MNNVIEDTILKGKYQDEDVSIPWIPLILNDMPFDFKMLQFPVLAFAINKSQGHSLFVPSTLKILYFSYVQSYVAYFRIRIPTKLVIYAQEKITKNVVYHKELE
jgi:hypothetical protein